MDNRDDTLVGPLRVLSLIAVILLIWTLSFYLLAKAVTTLTTEAIGDPSTLATVLFGASSIALFILSLFVASLAIVGWQSLKDHINKRVDDSTNTAVRKLETEMRGRLLNTMGYVIGEMSIKPDSVSPPTDYARDRLTEAIGHFRDAHTLLKKISEPAEFLALNNLVFYSCTIGDKLNGKILLEYAHRLNEMGQVHGATHLQLTACRVYLVYGDQKERREALELLSTLVDNPDIPTKQKKEAELYLASYISDH